MGALAAERQTQQTVPASTEVDFTLEENRMRAAVDILCSGNQATTSQVIETTRNTISAGNYQSLLDVLAMDQNNDAQILTIKKLYHVKLIKARLSTTERQKKIAAAAGMELIDDPYSWVC